MANLECDVWVWLFERRWCCLSAGECHGSFGTSVQHCLKENTVEHRSEDTTVNGGNGGGVTGRRVLYGLRSNEERFGSISNSDRC